MSYLLREWEKEYGGIALNRLSGRLVKYLSSYYCMFVCPLPRFPEMTGLILGGQLDVSPKLIDVPTNPHCVNTDSLRKTISYSPLTSRQLSHSGICSAESSHFHNHSPPV